MSPSRRQFLALAGAVGAGMLAGGCDDGSDSQGSTGSLLRGSRGPVRPFQLPLPIPPVARPVRRTADTDVYELTQRVASAEMLPGRRTTIWGYDGIFPGPTIVSRRGRTTVVRHRNRLPTPVSTHLHGGHTPAESDGFPTDLVLPPGGTGLPTFRAHRDDPAWTFHQGERLYTYPLDQRAATLWYHDHRMDFTGPQVWRGLAGFHLVTDAEEDRLPLPGGDRDIPLMIVDRSFDADGELVYPAVDPTLQQEPGVQERYGTGVIGDTILVNGAPWPVLEVAAVRYRFRILNASNARRYELALDPEPDGAPFTQVGSDGGLLAAPVAHRSIPIAQAERFDVVVDFSAFPVGTDVTLVNRLGTGPTKQVMRFRVVRRARDDSHVPDRLADLAEFEAMSEADAEVRRQFTFLPEEQHHGMLRWTVNGEVFDPATPIARPTLDGTEMWEFFAAPAHPIHVHLVQFKVLWRQRTGGVPLPKDSGWKDVLDLTPGERARVIARFHGRRGRYLMHCHNLEHEDMGMMARFDVS